MKIYVQLAQTDQERQEGSLLLKKVYMDEFGLDFDKFKVAFPKSFFQDLLLIRHEENLVGTASMMYPLEGIFPSEYIFGARICNNIKRNHASRTIEVGRLAKVANFPGGIITKSVMLATARYLEVNSLESWIATVKPALARILRSTGLEMLPFEIEPETDGDQAEIVKRYKGDNISVFEATRESTLTCFGKIDPFGDDFTIDIRL